MDIHHPEASQLDLASILSALGDATRLAMVGRLAHAGELACGQLGELGSKTVLSYHMAKLREAGIIQVRAQSTRRFVSLRRADLDARFPGLLDTILPSAAPAPVVTREPPAAMSARDQDDWVID